MMEETCTDRAQVYEILLDGLASKCRMLKSKGHFVLLKTIADITITGNKAGLFSR
ncbi:hypothetical protein L7E55_02375 [Pelotomaculum isophthalicicum JI]|uniref:Uncharacterized protein n=1 Tax=Pelotomaculum isophthalicicum JI TaxID=947010 RepID=A0A9X4JUY9_9FIRM|nr:hypothetical protein [Pelotomaculum isophthalicicum]MDF9407211.1 hypothetical protein [Pelotomaculum isophthalicicum JI]